MLRLLTNYARLATHSFEKKAAYFPLSCQQHGYSSLRCHPPSPWVPIYQNGFSHWIPAREQKFFYYNCKHKVANKYELAKKFSCLTTNSSWYNHARYRWMHLNQLCCFGRRQYSLLSRMACAVSLGLTRYNIVPGIVALLSGTKFACAQRSLVEGQCMPSQYSIFTKRLDASLFMWGVANSLLDGFSLVVRGVYLTLLFFPAMIVAPFSDKFGSKFRNQWLHIVRCTLEMAGPAFIKWGQWAATRPDLFPSDLCVELAKLHSNAPAHSFAFTKATIEKAFGCKLSELFETFEEEPVASGSIAQVHRASLKHQHPGKQVAVKVRHPGVGESIKRDFVIINFVAKGSSLIPGVSWLRLDESVRQFATFMISQVDLSREAAHLSRFIYNFRKWKHVSFPQPLYPFVHPAVLVETFEQGESVTRFISEYEGNHRMRRDLAQIGTHAFLKMLLEDNFIHGDMHPGNILVRVKDRKTAKKKLFGANPKPHIVFLDVGMTSELSKSDRSNLQEFFKAVATRDGRTAAECTLQLSKNQHCPNPGGFIEELDKTFTFWGTPEGDDFHPLECMHHLLDTVRRYRVNIDGHVCTVMVTILVLEGWQRKLDPAFDIMRTLKSLLLENEVKQPVDFVFS